MVGRTWVKVGVCGAVVSLWLLSAAAQAASPTISWKDNSNNEAGFRCYRLKTTALPELKVCEVGPDVETCNSSEAGILGFCYQCSAFNALGESGRVSTACWVPPAAPGAVGIAVP